MTNTRYLLSWQWLFLKRHLFTLQGIIPLVVSILFQGILMASMFSSKENYSQALVMVIAYSASFAFSQIAAVYQQALAVTSSGLLGIAPISARARVTIDV